MDIVTIGFVVLPLRAITYIWILCISKKILNEIIIRKKLIGVTLIIIIIIGALSIACN